MTRTRAVTGMRAGMALVIALLTPVEAGAGGDAGRDDPLVGAAAGATPATAASTTVMLAHAGGGAATPGARAAARTLQSQALARLKAGAIDEAARLLTRAVEKDPDNAGMLTDLGFTLGRLGRRADAEAALRAAIAKDPRRFYAYVNLADLWSDDPSRWERRDQIGTLLEKGLDALKDDPKGRLLVLLRLANFERVVGRTAAARARLAPLLAESTGVPLARAQRKRVLDLLEAIALDERAQALEDWPAPAPDNAQVAAANGAESSLDAGRAEEARDRLDTLVRRAPSWPRARFLRARALEALGRVDEAVRDLEIAVNLSPSNAAAWRVLGRLLATQGGALEADRADEALRNALILEPSWTEPRALRMQLARRRAALAPASTSSSTRTAEPTEHARALYQEAEEWIEVGDPGGLGRDRVEQALAESPGYVEAAVTLYALTGRVSAETVTALWNDGAALWTLASGIRRLSLGAGAGTGANTDAEPARAGGAPWVPWIDRAVALDVQEARFARALTRVGAGDKAGALADLLAYVAREPRPIHLAEARALRAGLAGTEGRPSPELMARIRLLEDRPEAALAALGGACAADQPGDRLRAMGLVHEYQDQRQAARRCYELASASGDDAALVRLARLDARLPDAELRDADRAALNRAAGKGIAAAHWALSRLATSDGNQSAALLGAERALALVAAHTEGSDGDHNDKGAAGADPWVAAARAARDGLAATRQETERAKQERRRRLAATAVGLAGLLLALVLRRRFHGRAVEAALRQRPALFPEVARAVAEIRHDVLKHRAGVLGLVANAGAPRGDVRRALTEPQPTSDAVAAIYQRLVQAARGIGLSLRPLTREPTFGPLTGDLLRAETLLAMGANHPPKGDNAHAEADATLASATAGIDAALLAIDARLRGTHGDRLGALLQLGPRTRLDATEVGAWIGAVEAATRRAGTGWAPTALLLGDLAVEFPVERNALHAIFANLLRNAQAAVAGHDDARVIIRIDRERDVTGRQVAQLLVGDSAAAGLTLETIEAREGGRGLAIVRDLVRHWRGHMVVRPETSPFVKQVGACFPL